VAALHETVAVPEPVTLPGVIEPQTRPEGTLSVRITTPANLLTAATVTVDVLEALTLTIPELATMVKSRN
jgi:hypothetical protein